MENKRNDVENLKKSADTKPTKKSRTNLDDLLNASIAEAELESYEKGKSAKQKVKTLKQYKKEEILREKRKKDLKKTDSETSVQTEQGTDKRINFEEYRPKFTESLGFKLFLVGLVLALIGASFLLFYYIKGQGQYKVPLSVTLNTSENGLREYYHYTDKNENTRIGLIAWINEKYTGKNHKINITTSGNNEILVLPTEVQSGQIFYVDIIKEATEYAKGGVVRILVSDDATGLQKDWVDVIIDTPVTSIEFSGETTTVYATQEIPVNISQKTGESEYKFNESKDRLYKPMSYELFVESESGEYYKDDDDNFLSIEQGEEDDYLIKYSNLPADTNKIATINSSGVLEGTGYGDIWVVASCTKYINHIKAPDTVIVSAQKYTVNLVDISGVRINNEYTTSDIYLGQEFLYDLSEAIFIIESAEDLTWFNDSDIQEFYKKFFTVEADPSTGVTIVMDGTVAKITVTGLAENTTFNLKLKYKGEDVALRKVDGTEIEIIFTVKNH